MKKIFFTASVLGALLLNSCTKEPETITVTETEIVNESVVISLQPFEQEYYASLGYYSFADLDFSITNIGNKQIEYVDVVFEATTLDGSKYTSTSYISAIGIGESISGNQLIEVASKQCASIIVKEVEVTTSID